MDFLLNQTKIEEIVEAGEATPLESELEIEDCLAAIGPIDNRIDFLKRLKKNRTAQIDAAIKKQEGRKQILRDVILSTLEAHKIGSLDFPGVGRVVRKKSKGKWIVNDEEKLLEALAEKLDEEKMGIVVKKTPKIVKAALNKILDIWNKSDEEVPDSVEKTEDRFSLTVTMHEVAPEPEFIEEEEYVSGTLDSSELDRLEI